MTRRNWIFRFCSLLLVPASLLAQSPAPAAPAIPQNQPTQKVLIHVGTSSPENWQAALKKANDLMASSAKPYDTYVEILATGDGLKLIDKTNPGTSEISKSLDKDVMFVACHASMKTNPDRNQRFAKRSGYRED